jgi:hypothetical protein
LPKEEYHQSAERLERLGNGGKTIEHYSGKGECNISGIYYEVLNEPDLAQFGSWKPGGDKNYITLYQYASTGARNAQNVTTLSGGPSTTDCTNMDSGPCSKRCTVNFLSWHTYQQILRHDKDQRISNGSCRTQASLIPKLITEFDLPRQKYFYGSQYAAAHAAAVIRQLITGGPTYLLSFQPVDGPGCNPKRLGTHTTHQTDLGNPLLYLQFYRLNGRIPAVLSGEGTWVTAFASIKDAVVRVLLVNFDRRGFIQKCAGHLEMSHPRNLLPEPATFRTDTTITETATGSAITKQIPMTSQRVAILELSKQ